MARESITGNGVVLKEEKEARVAGRHLWYRAGILFSLKSPSARRARFAKPARSVNVSGGHVAPGEGKRLCGAGERGMMCWPFSFRAHRARRNL